MNKDDEDPPIWVTVIKLVAIAVVLIGGTGVALWYVNSLQEREQPSMGMGTGNNKLDWGIVSDNPVRQHH